MICAINLIYLSSNCLPAALYYKFKFLSIFKLIIDTGIKYVHSKIYIFSLFIYYSLFNKLFFSIRQKLTVDK